MRSSKFSRSSKHLNLELPHRKIKLSGSSHDLHCPLALFSTRKDHPVLPKAPSVFPTTQEPVIIQVEDQILLQSFSSYIINIKHQHFKQGMNPQGKDFIVLSKIEEFYGQYNRYAQNVYALCKSTRWIVISNAVNNEAVQEEFNRIYEPIKFVFLRSLAAAVNYINFLSSDPNREVRLSFFSRIINFQAYRNNYACIMQESRQNLRQIKPQINSLWLISQQDLPTLKKSQLNYYLLDRNSIFEQTLKLTSSPEELVYLLIQSHQEILDCLGIDQIESECSMLTIRQNLLRGTYGRYCQKVIEKYLSEEIVYGLVGFPPDISKQLSKHLHYVAVVPKQLHLNHASFYCIYYDSKDQSDILGFSYKKEDKVVNQAYRIKNHYEAIEKIANSYRRLSRQTKNYGIVSYKISDLQLLREIQLFTRSTVKELHILDDVNSIFQSKAILIATFTETQRQLLMPQLLDRFIDYDKCDYNSLIVHNQVLLQLQGLKKSEEGGWEQFQQSPKVISFNVQLPEFSSEPIYVNKEVKQFKETLSKIQQNYHHLIVMAIEDYNQQHQKILEEAQKLQNVTFEVYLKYGSEFILRSKKQKYQFLKRDQLISTINQIIRLNHRSCYLTAKPSPSFQSLDHEDYHQKIYSTMLQDNYLQPSYLSTPNLQQSNQTELFILIPKTVPHHSLLNRSAQNYTLLVYGSMEQAHYFSRHLSRQMHAVAIVGESDRVRHLQNLPLTNFSYAKVKHLGQKEVRDEIDNIVEKYGLTKKLGTINKVKANNYGIVLYDSSDSKQSKLILSMNSIFKSSKILTIPKNQFRQIKHRYNIIQNLTIYELGNPELAYSKKVRNVIDLLKVFMSPYQASIQFVPDKLAFSRRQFLVREYLERSKKAKIKGRLRELSLSRCTSPRSKSFVAKECVNEAGIVIIESISMTFSGKRSKFSNKNELIVIIYEALSKGNHLIAILTQEQYQSYIQLIDKRPAGIFWIIVTKSIHKCIVKEPHLVYCVHEQISIVLSSIASRFRTLKQVEFVIGKQQGTPFPQKEAFTLTVYENWSDFIEDLLPTDEPISIVKKISRQYIEVQQLSGALVFGKGDKLPSLLCLFQSQSIEKKKSSEKSQMIIILTRVHNRQFIERCLLILQEKNCLIVTYRQLQNILLYVQICSTLLVLQETDCIFNSNMLRLNPADTPASFSPKLGGFISSLRKDV